MSIDNQQVLTLTPLQKRHLKALAHSLKPVVLIGNNGLTEAVLAEIGIALEVHELIKIRVFGNDSETRKAYSQQICETQEAALVQTIGKVLTVYRPAEKPKICLPK